jgi:acetyltransferase-like isoleucine patch superfamily enzyme
MQFAHTHTTYVTTQVSKHVTVMITTVFSGFDLISIGHSVTVGRDTVLSAAFIEPTDAQLPPHNKQRLVLSFAAVRIGSNVSIGDQAIVLRDVRLSNVSAVGACTLLMPDTTVPEGAFVMGVRLVEHSTIYSIMLHHVKSSTT